ncbi:High-affinity iron permease, putative, partial [Candida maltosa Xu316]
MAQVFNVQIFFVVFRESLEAVIVVSVLLAFVKQSMSGPTADPKIKKRLYKQIWLGAILGVIICLIIGCAFIGAFYGL